MHVVSPAEPKPAEEVYRQISSALQELLPLAGGVRILLENTAGSGPGIGAGFASIARIIELCDCPELGFCFDTAHAFGAGYPVDSASGVAGTVEEMAATIGLDRLAVVHANDSKAELGSHRDRHEEAAAGLIGRDGFPGPLREPGAAPPAVHSGDAG